MHICFITSEFPKKGYPHGGIGTFVATIAPELIKKGIKVSVVGINYTNNTEIENYGGITVYRLAPKNIKGLSWYFKAQTIANQIKQINLTDKIDIVEVAEAGLAFLPKLKNIKYVIRLHGGHHFFAEGENRGINWWKGFQEKRSFKKADAFIAVSNYVKNHTEKYLSYHDKPIIKINNPISLTKFQPIATTIVNKFNLVFVGTVCEKKGVKQLIQAFQLVKQKQKQAQLNIYGRDWFFPNGKSYITYLKEIFTKEELYQVNFKGVVSHDELPNIYQAAHLCVFPSHIETQGLVAPEAMAMEKCVVFSQTGPGKETITSYESGILCDPLSHQDIADKIIWAFNNTDEVIKIEKQARVVALQKFDLDKIIDQNIEFYKSIC